MPLDTLTMTGEADCSSSGRKAWVTRTMLTTPAPAAHPEATADEQVIA